jgi:branched-chain amino acid transport system permease protein
MKPNHKKYIGLVLLIGILCLVPLVVKSPYYMHLLIMVGMNAILAMTFILMLRTGMISLAIAAFWGVGAYVSALLAMKLDLSFWISLPLSTVITGLVALAIGFVLVKNPGFGFIIETVVIGEIAVLGFAHLPYFGGYQGIVSIPPIDPIHIPFLFSIQFTSKSGSYYLILFLFLLVAIGYSAFYSAWTGRAWLAIGLNPRLAESKGVNTYRYRLLAFVIGSAGAGLAGSFYAHYYGAIGPTTFNVFKTIYIHIYAILGGVGFPIIGPAIGAFIMIIVPETLRVAKEVEPIITGFLLILLVLFLPDGLLSLFIRRKGSGKPLERLAQIARWIKGLGPFTR